MTLESTVSGFTIFSVSMKPNKPDYYYYYQGKLREKEWSTRKKFKNSSDSETHSLKRKSNRQNQPDTVDETKDDTEMWTDSSEVLWMWTRRASQISARRCWGRLWEYNEF